MDILPAIDLRDGKVVRLLQGDYAQQTTYSDDPVAVARQFVEAGARWIHMVDLDAARTGRHANTEVVRAVAEAVDARIELGGGARDDRAVEAMLELGVSRVVVGSAALKDWAWFERLVQRPELAGRIALGLDAKAGRLAIHGWTEQVQATPAELAARVCGWPLGAIVYTDIGRDGMLEGVNVEATAQVIAATDVPVIASGGVGSIDDVVRCKQAGCGGVIIGKAWYEGRIDLRQAVALARG
ncbi:MAG: 1-(5-phosphoribosyl)-5-[(5-phosphoribosylamino)methylideneamino]imidazole-4-carboxamide isomerase [Phycisphaerae bacterium]|jgi:phosphoribosylformimino-5-aminoimidazole carboxamide ribotide isomerase